jgi:hypothetical protein
LSVGDVVVGVYVCVCVSGRRRDDCIFITGLRVHTIVGVNPAEREERQDVVVYLQMWAAGRVRAVCVCVCVCVYVCAPPAFGGH